MKYYYDGRHERKTLDAYPASMYYHIGYNMTWDSIDIDNETYWTDILEITLDTNAYGALDYDANIVPDTFLILVGVPLL